MIAIGLPFPNSSFPVSLNYLIRVSNVTLVNGAWNSRNYITDVKSTYFNLRFIPEIRHVFILCYWLSRNPKSNSFIPGW